LARHAVDTLLARGCEVIITASHTAQDIWQQELGLKLEASLADWSQRGVVRYYRPGDFNAPIASGSYPIAGMIVIPCSISTIGSLASGFSTNLIQRAADCCIKEGRRLVVVPRETPLSAIHLENLLKLARSGVFVVPPVPAFYTHPRDVDDIVHQIVGRALSVLGVPDALDPQHVWTGRTPPREGAG
jgi:4-hydroxy-3-polyprenylbenzoate decarboxylase